MKALRVRRASSRAGVRGPLGLAFHALFRTKTGLFGVGVVVFFSLMGVLAPFIAPYDPYEQSVLNRLKPPSWEHPLGTDEFGRDILTRIMYGAKTTLMAGVVTVLMALSIGLPLGLIAGYYGGYIDHIVSRGADILLAFPGYLLALAIVAFLGPGLFNAMLAVAIFLIPIYIRTIRGIVLSVKNLEYIEASKVFGTGSLSIMKDHIFPNVIPELIVLTTFSTADAILVTSALSFLGLGAQPPEPEWGLMASSGRYYLAAAPWVSIFPAAMIFLVVLAFNLIGEALVDTLIKRR